MTTSEEKSGSETKHTPGPWAAFNAGQFVASLSEPRRTIAELTGVFRDPSKVANAKLIAAAPDLADQLEEAVSILRAIRDGSAPPVSPLDCIDTSEAILRAAGRGR